MSEIENRITGAVDGMRGEIIAFLADLVRAKSVNPPGNTKAAIEVISAKLRSFGVEPEVVGPEEHNKSVLARVGSKGGYELVFNSHMDTVPIGEEKAWRVDPFGGQIIDDELYGRGSADAKGCLAGMIMAAKALKEAGVELKRGHLVLNPVGDEETLGLQGAKWILDQGLIRPDGVIIGEITTNKIAIAHKGILWLKLVTHGRTAHASTPWEGVNAIDKMVDLLAAIRSEVGTRLAARRHPLTPPPSMNLGIINGGVKTNVVADRCEAIIDRRLLPNETVEDARQEFIEVIRKVQSKDPTFQAELEVIVTGSPLETAPDAELTRVCQRAARDLGLSDELVGYQQASDGRFFSERGIPTILIGPGIPELAHTPNEHVDVAGVVECTKFYALIAAKLLA